MHQTKKFDFDAIMKKPLVLTMTRTARLLDDKTVRAMVQAYHPAIRLNLKTVALKA